MADRAFQATRETKTKTNAIARRGWARTKTEAELENARLLSIKDLQFIVGRKMLKAV